MTSSKPSVSALRIARLDGRPTVVSGHNDGTLRRWDVATGRPLGDPVTAHTHWVRDAVAAELDGRPVVVTAGDETVRVWDLGTGAAVGQPITGHKAHVMTVADIDETATVLMVTDLGPFGQLMGWDLATRAHTLGPSPDWAQTTAIVEHDAELVAVITQDDGNDVILQAWHLTNGAKLSPPLAGGEVAGTVRRAPVCLADLDGRTVLVSGAGAEGALRVWDMATGTLVHEPLIGHTDQVTAVTIARPRDGRRLIVSAGYDGTIRVWDLATGLAVGKPLTGHDGRVKALDTAELDGDAVVVSGGKDGALLVWDPASGLLRAAADQDRAG